MNKWAAEAILHIPLLFKWIKSEYQRRKLLLNYNCFLLQAEVCFFSPSVFMEAVIVRIYLELIFNYFQKRSKSSID